MRGVATMYSSSSDASRRRAAALAERFVNTRPGARCSRSALMRLTCSTTSKSRARPGIP